MRGGANEIGRLFTSLCLATPPPPPTPTGEENPKRRNGLGETNPLKRRVVEPPESTDTMPGRFKKRPVKVSARSSGLGDLMLEGGAYNQARWFLAA